MDRGGKSKKRRARGLEQSKEQVEKREKIVYCSFQSTWDQLSSFAHVSTNAILHRLDVLIDIALLQNSRTRILLSIAPINGSPKIASVIRSQNINCNLFIIEAFFLRTFLFKHTIQRYSILENNIHIEYAWKYLIATYHAIYDVVKWKEKQGDKQIFGFAMDDTLETHFCRKETETTLL